MLFTTIYTTTIVSALISTSNALPQTAASLSDITDWPVTNFAIGCSPGGCTYSFSISGPFTTDVGTVFSTYCSVTDVQQRMVPCADQNVQANLAPTQGEGLVLVVDRCGGGTDRINGYMSGKTTAALTGEPAVASFVILAKFYGDVSGSVGRWML